MFWKCNSSGCFLLQASVLPFLPYDFPRETPLGKPRGCKNVQNKLPAGFELPFSACNVCVFAKRKKREKKKKTVTSRDLLVTQKKYDKIIDAVINT